MNTNTTKAELSSVAAAVAFMANIRQQELPPLLEIELRQSRRNSNGKAADAVATLEMARAERDALLSPPERAARASEIREAMEEAKALRELDRIADDLRIELGKRPAATKQVAEVKAKCASLREEIDKLNKRRARLEDRDHRGFFFDLDQAELEARHIRAAFAEAAQSPGRWDGELEEYVKDPNTLGDALCRLSAEHDYKWEATEEGANERLAEIERLMADASNRYDNGLTGVEARSLDQIPGKLTTARASLAPLEEVERQILEFERIEETAMAEAEAVVTIYQAGRELRALEAGKAMHAAAGCELVGDFH